MLESIVLFFQKQLMKVSPKEHLLLEVENKMSALGSLSRKYSNATLHSITATLSEIQY